MAISNYASSARAQTIDINDTRYKVDPGLMLMSQCEIINHYITTLFALHDMGENSSNVHFATA